MDHGARGERHRLRRRLHPGGLAEESGGVSRLALCQKEPAAAYASRHETGEGPLGSVEEGARILLLLAPWPGEGHYRGSQP